MPFENISIIYRKVKFLLGMVVVLSVMTLVGCTSLPSSSGDFDSKGLPNSKYFVGGGLDIQWRAPQPGTAYLVDEKTARIVITRSLDTDDEYEFDPGSIESDVAKQIFGVNLNELKFSLYFIPTNQE